MIRGEKQPKNTYRIIVHICIFNSKGKMLIQQRQPFKKGFSNMWDITVGGSAIAGDDSRMAAQRELLEELGVCLVVLVLMVNVVLVVLNLLLVHVGEVELEVGLFVDEAQPLLVSLQLVHHGVLRLMMPVVKLCLFQIKGKVIEQSWLFLFPFVNI